MKKNNLRKEKGSITAVLIIIGLLVVVFIGVLFFRPPAKKQEEVKDVHKNELQEDRDVDFNQKLISIVDDFIGLPYIASPLNEETLYTEEGFNSTTLILSVVAKAHQEKKPEEVIKKINYYPPEVVKFQNRNHFSSYRNKVSFYFNDITDSVGKEKTKTKNVILNKKNKNGKRIIDIEWEREIELKYIPIEFVSSVLPSIPSPSGVMFVQDGDEEIGLDVRGEGIIIENKDFVYSSSKEKSVVRVNFLEYIESTSFDGIIIYEFVEI